MPKQIVGATPNAGIDWNDYKGKLLVIEPLDVEKDIKTIHGVSDAVRANVYALLGPNESADHEDTLVFPRVLQGQLRRKVGNLVVGRLTQGEARKGQDPPWVLGEPTEKDLAKANEFVARKFTTAASAPSDDDGFEDDADEAF
jgi:hypothetical protein